MTEERLCPHCGAPLTSDSPVDDRGPSTEGVHEDELIPSPITLLAPGSKDDHFVANPFGPKVASAEPDPILGEFVTPSSQDAIAARAKPPRPDSSAAFPALETGARARPARVSPGGSGDGPEEEPARARVSWASVLVISYASAITLALAWTLIRKPKEPEKAPTVEPAAVEKNAVGRLGSRSRRIELPEPILAERVARFNAPLRLGSLEVTPIEVRRERVGLQKSSFSGKTDKKDGGKNAFALRLRLRNTSKDEVFAPVDPAFIRERDKEVVDSFVESAGGQRIYPYPLAVESEWSIAGQDFSDLRPGEVREVSIVSNTEAPADSAGPFTWRVRLRTGIGRTDVIGVRWTETKQAPAPPPPPVTPPKSTIPK